MKLLLLLLILSFHSAGQNFRFAFISDTHIGSPNGSAEEDLRRTVADINARGELAFVVLTGDITELGTDAELKLARQILDSLHIPYYIIPGNHDTGWSESGGQMFTTVFGADRFHFTYGGIHFLGCASGPYVRMSDGHVPRDAVNWLRDELEKIGKKEPVVFLNHYPLDPGLDNWYEITDLLRQYAIQAVLCGHGHANRSLVFEGIPGVMGRSNLRARAARGGYNIVERRGDSLIFSEQRPGEIEKSPWTVLKMGMMPGEAGKKFDRPDYSMNDSFPAIREKWRYTASANIISTPAWSRKRVVTADQAGRVIALNPKNGRTRWIYQTGGPIFSSPAIAGHTVVLGSADGYVYALSVQTGRLRWKFKTGAAVLGAPLVQDGHVYIGGSDGNFRKIELASGEQVWAFDELKGPVVSLPVLHRGLVIFGAWDNHLYALREEGGQLAWKWSNGSTVRNYSPAACIPVIQDDVVYIAAPDRFLTAIDSRSGATLWRSNAATVRESLGISENGKLIYGKTMQDTLVAFNTSRSAGPPAWKLHLGFGYEHVPSMLIEKTGTVYFGTKNGVVYAVDPMGKTLRWKYKIDNSMVNTVNPFSEGRLLAATMDGKLVLLEVRGKKRN